MVGDSSRQGCQPQLPPLSTAAGRDARRRHRFLGAVRVGSWLGHPRACTASWHRGWRRGPGLRRSGPVVTNTRRRGSRQLPAGTGRRIRAARGWRGRRLSSRAGESGVTWPLVAVLGGRPPAAGGCAARLRPARPSRGVCLTGTSESTGRPGLRPRGELDAREQAAVWGLNCGAGPRPSAAARSERLPDPVSRRPRPLSRGSWGGPLPVTAAHRPLPGRAPAACPPSCRPGFLLRGRVLCSLADCNCRSLYLRTWEVVIMGKPRSGRRFPEQSQ